MKFVLNPSLEHIALVKVAIILWNKDDIRALLIKFYFTLPGSDGREMWKETQKSVLVKALELPLPALLKKKLLGFIHPIGIQIINWLKYHGDPYFGLDLPNKLYWTSQGTIDKKKTAEVLIKDESLDITRRYKLACIYCFEDDIPELWKRVPEEQKTSFYNTDFPRQFRQQDLVVFWTYLINQEVAELENMIDKRLEGRYSPHQFAFGYAADGGNKVATEYFLKKLNPEERKKSLPWAAKFVTRRFYDSYRMPSVFPTEYYIEVLCFLLSQMEEEQQIKSITGWHYEVLKSFLNWPWQCFFIETANHLWKILDAIDYDCLLEVVIKKVISGYEDWNYQALFREFWRQSPNAHKMYCLRRCAYGEILPDLFKIGDKENIRLILKNASVEDKEEIIFNYHGKSICENLVYRNNRDALIYFLRECISSKNVMLKFKKEFEEHIKLRHSENILEEEKDVWSKFFQLLDDLIH